MNNNKTAANDSQKETRPEELDNEARVTQEKSKIDKQSAVLGALLTDVVDYNKDKMLNHSTKDSELLRNSRYSF